MKITTLVATLAAIGTSSVALADSRPVAKASARFEASVRFGSTSRVATTPTVRDHRRVDVRHENWSRDHRTTTSYPYPSDLYPSYPSNPVIANTRVTDNLSLYTGPIASSSIGGWIALTDPTRIDAGREFINVGAQTGRFNTLQLRNIAGSSEITMIGIEFATSNGEVAEMQTVKLDNRLDAYRSTITIDLNGSARKINRVIVYGSTANHSAYQVVAR